jgi:hypothetical protein
MYGVSANGVMAYQLMASSMAMAMANVVGNINLASGDGVSKRNVSEKNQPIIGQLA